MSQSAKILCAGMVAVCWMALFAVDAGAVEATVDISKKYQTMEGFGGGFMFGMWPYGKSYKDELYDSIFNKAGCNIVRIGNNYDPQKDSAVDELPMMKEVVERYPDVKVFMASWSPPTYLKERDTIAGIVDGVKLSIKKSNGAFMYAEYADYWYKSARYFQDSGLALSWVSIQNEPDWPASWDGCLFLPVEGTAASYGKALDAVHARFQTLPTPIPLIGPDMTGPRGIDYTIDQYIDNMDTGKIDALCHHFYNGDSEAEMRAVRTKVGKKKIFQTEWLVNDTIPRYQGGEILTWFDHAQIIQRALTVEEISMYLVFALSYKVASMHTFFSLDTLNNTYETRPIYYAFKHFSKSIKRGWKRVGISATGLQVSAFASDNNDQMAVIVINTGAATTLSLKGLPATIDSGCIYQTTKSGAYQQSKKYQSLGRFAIPLSEIPLDGSSITTIELWNKAVSSVQPKQVSVATKVTTAISSTVQEQGKIAVTVTVAAGNAYTLALYDASGKQVFSSVKVACATGAMVHRFSRPAGGVYLAVLESAGTRTTVPIVVR